MEALETIERMGIDWRSIFGALAPAGTAHGLAVALSPIAGSMPRVSDGAGYSEITFTPEQETRLAEWILTQLRSEPGPVRVHAGGLALKVITRQYWPWFAAAVAVGLVVGYGLRGKR